MKAFAALACAVALAVTGCGASDESQRPPPADTGFEITGRWEGELDQKDLAPFRVEADIRGIDRSARNRVSYSGIGCSGSWTYRGPEGPSLVFREVIDRGGGGECKGVGRVALTPSSDDRLGYEFRGGGIVSRGTLARVR